MKVTDLLESKDLAYDSDLKRVMGDTKEWLEKAGIGPNDMKEAMKEIKHLPQFLDIAGSVKYISTPKQEGNGSLVFTTDDWVAHISAMGQIRFATPSTWRHYTTSSFSRLASPKPGLVHGNPVASLVKTMKAALIELAKKPKMVKALRDAKQEMVKEAITPNSEGWYIKQTRGKDVQIIAGPMTEEQADIKVEQGGGSDRGISKAFITKMAIEKAKEAADY
jgi:hypothetical protein